MQHDPRWQDIASAAVAPLGPKERELAPSGRVLTFVFEGYPDGLEVLRPALRSHRISTSLWVRREFTNEDRLSAEYLILGTEGVVKSVEGTLQWEDVSVCTHCACLETRWDLEPLGIAEQPQEEVLTSVDWHPMVVSKELARSLERANFSGLELLPVGPDRPAQWYGLQPTHILPSVAVPPTRLPRSPSSTPQCAANHLWDGLTHSQLSYRRSEFIAADFNQSYELFGDISTAQRTVVVSQQVYSLLVERGVKQLDCEPVQVIG